MTHHTIHPNCFKCASKAQKDAPTENTKIPSNHVLWAVMIYNRILHSSGIITNFFEVNIYCENSHWQIATCPPNTRSIFVELLRQTQEHSPFQLSPLVSEILDRLTHSPKSKGALFHGKMWWPSDTKAELLAESAGEKRSWGFLVAFVHNCCIT